MRTWLWWGKFLSKENKEWGENADLVWIPLFPFCPRCCISCSCSYSSLGSLFLHKTPPPCIVYGPNHSPENVKPAVLGMLPKETVLLQTLFLPKYFQSSWRAVKPQWLSAVFPSSISPGPPWAALSNWIVFHDEEETQCCMRELVDLRIILQVLKTLDPESLSCQTLGLPECAPFLDGTFSKAA